ncbi:unnamed protein product [Clonostachys byssicola]|uniref:Fumarylacetoacetase-like C-terminal domain-containing protein n=1 Tax=Clonostachys byssicola TaxID=160290 RepID=A0A9N9YDQ7_9HYPO|nr:unnamed protein product [Clonostachys byssicola]
MASAASFKRLVRFVAKDSTQILIGQPVKEELDIGITLRQGQDVVVDVFSGLSVLNPGVMTGKTESIGRILSPLAQHEVGTIRCIGLNYNQHAKEVGMEPPSIPTLFMKPSTAIGDPWPAHTILPRLTQVDDCGDFESELAVVIGKLAKNVSEAEAMDYVLGYTAANDVSSRTSQLNQSQWCFSKGFDGSCPIGKYIQHYGREYSLLTARVGPTLVSTSIIPDPAKLWIRGLKNNRVLQDCGISDLIFSVPKLVSFLSQSTTLLPGTVIITGTPAGVGMGRKPKETLRDGDEFAIEILPHIGTLVNVFVNE